LKLGFPYFIAAEFALFQSGRKFTLPHLTVGITFALVGALTFQFGSQLPIWASVFLGLLFGILFAWLAFRLFRLVLPCLGKLVSWGVLAPPDQNRLDRMVASYLGKSGTVGR